ncbi:MAG TPA: BamA/TamA family outer membrane protein [Usitatibacter sp.]|nr:BamA/TamA family outer membrane protein [Usitatibacter sp.]
MKPLAALLFACFVCGAALADEPSAPPGEAPTRNGPQPEKEHREPRAFTVTWEAPRELRVLFDKFLPPPKPDAAEDHVAPMRPWIRDVKKRVPEIAAAEGYFSATLDIQVDDARDHATVRVAPGPRTTVAAIDIAFEGDLKGEGPEREKRREKLRQSFAMKAGQPFRSADWDVAKTRIEEALTERDYASGTVAASRAEVDAQAATAHLSLTLDSGPPFTFGDVTIKGLKRYSESLVRRVVNLGRGERFSRDRLEELQRLIQNGPWFSTVVAEIEPDPANAQLVPVTVTVTERPSREIGLAIGYGTDDGARAETLYHDRDLFGRGFDLQSSIRASQKDQIGYVDVYLPPGLSGTAKKGDLPFKDSVGVLAEHSTIQDANFSRFAVAGYRHWFLDRFELQAGLSYQIERSYPTGADVTIRRALAPVVSATWRRVDNIFDPRRGGVLNVQFAAGSKSLASGDDFLKAYLQYQHWIPLGRDNQFLLRTEIGRTFTQNPDRIPDDFLFRAGGSRSNRGYAYQSLGVQEGTAVVGGRFLATGTAEFVHWLDDKWGAAVFTDVGTASDSPSTWEALKSYGVGARYKTPAGPFALDVAYAARDHKFRLAFSVTVAF